MQLDVFDFRLGCMQVCVWFPCVWLDGLLCVLSLLLDAIMVYGLFALRDHLRGDVVVL